MEELKQQLDKINLKLDNKVVERLWKFKEIVLEKNKVLNLTGITEDKDFILKHLIDSLSVLPYIPNTSKDIIDIGTGAGFPGVPIKIAVPKLNVTLLDSSKKKVKFLNETIKELDLENIKAVGERAEDLGMDKNYREKFDVAISRAVALLPVLVEYSLPFVKVGGIFIAQKTQNEEELKSAERAISLLGGKIKEIVSIKIDDLPERSLIIIEKISKTTTNFPRKPGVASKEPIS
ncbi:MAG: 16S rRNA (guanine(527)-N(7))-methyltransferase RsmG [Candidatus Paceibacterota bacterium]